MSHLAMQFWTCSWQAAAIAALVLLIRAVFRGRLSPLWRCGLWAIVLIRLVLPTLPASTFSLFGVTKLYAHLRQPIAATPAPKLPAAEDITGVITRSGLLPSESDGPIVAPSLPALAHVPVSRPFTHWLAIAWLAGVVIFTVRLTWTNVAFARRLSRIQPLFDGPLFTLLQGCCADLGIRHAPALLLSDAVSVPALAGVIQPRILLPSGMALSLSPAESRLILLHELYHLKRCDLAIDWVCTALNVIHWFNPLLWIAATCYRADRELLRDVQVLRTAGAESAECYGLTILRMARQRRPVGHLPVLAAFIQGRGRIQERIQMIALFSSRHSGFSIVGLVLMIGIGCSTLTVPKAEKNVTVDDSAKPPTKFLGEAVATPVPPAADVEETPPLVLEKQAAAARRVDAALAKRIPELNLDGKRLVDVIDGFKEEAPINIFVDWSALEKVGVSREAPVTARMKDIPIGKAIKAVLGEVAMGKAHLSFYSNEFGVVVTTLEEERRQTTSTRTYDIRDLLVEVPDYEPDFSPSATAGLTTKPATTREKRMTRQERVELLIRLIKETIDPDSWRDNGGIVGAVKELSGQLVVTQSAEAQRQLTNLLLQLRQTRSLQVQVDTKFVLLDAWAVERFNLHAAPATRTTRPSTLLTDVQIESLLHPTDGKSHAKLIAGPRLQVYNGQRGYVLAATQRRYISGYSMDAARNHFDPTLETAEQGAIVDVQATISSDRKYATLTLRPRITRLDRLDDEIWPNSPADHPLKIQRPVNSVRQLQTTVSVADGQTVIVGGFVDSVIGDTKARIPATAAEKPATQSVADEPSFLSQLMTPPTSGMELFLFVRPTIILDGPPPQEPATRPAAETGR
jgi:beta-lactamase regulating signal transducer with metallopeptidase domain